MKKVPVVKITTPHVAADLAGLPFEATVAMADVATAMREGLPSFSTAAGLVVMQQMLTAELAGIVADKHAKLGVDRVGNWHGTRTCRVRSWSSGCLPASPPAVMSKWPNLSVRSLGRRYRSRRCHAGSSPRRRRRSPSCSARICPGWTRRC